MLDQINMGGWKLYRYMSCSVFLSSSAVVPLLWAIGPLALQARAMSAGRRSIARRSEAQQWHPPAVDDVLIVDWSASATRKKGSDSIWISHVEVGSPAVVKALVNPPTRAEALAWLLDCISTAQDSGRRILCGFDFSLGYVEGYADLLAAGFGGIPEGAKSAFDATTLITSRIVHADVFDNANNRFEAAALINAKTGRALFWGHPTGQTYASLSRTKKDLPANLEPNTLSQRRITESGLQVATNWQLYGIGSVGSQVLTGLPILQKLRVAFPETGRVWPFEDISAPSSSVIFAEVWPTMHAHPIPGIAVKDAWQVQSQALHFAALANDDERWAALFHPPSWHNLSPQQRQAVVQEEGWILGVP